jgi:hypothetical protein
MMAIIRDSADQFDGEFFETINRETERFTSRPATRQPPTV